MALGPKRWQVPNTKQGVGQLVKQLKAERSKVHAICEASGGYEEQFSHDGSESHFSALAPALNPA